MYENLFETAEMQKTNQNAEQTIPENGMELSGEMETAENVENTENTEAVGYSSDYYEHRMASALESGNAIAYKNAKYNWAQAKAREAVGSGEAAESPDEKEAVGYSEIYDPETRVRSAAHLHYPPTTYPVREIGNNKFGLGERLVGSGEALEPEENAAESGGTVGYSSEYYKSELARDIKAGREIAAEHSYKNYIHALEKEAKG